MKKISLLALATLCTVSLFAAPKKSVDDIAAEVEASLGPVEWVFKNNLAKAKTLQDENLFILNQKDSGTVITICRPMSEEDETMQIRFLRPEDVGNLSGENQIIGTLKKNEVFVTYEGEMTNIAHLWVLKDKKELPGVVKSESNGGISINDMSYTALKYRGWSTDAIVSSSKKDILQGATMWDNGIGYYTLSNIKKGEFSVMMIDTNSRTLIEYQMLYLGYTDQCSITKNQYDANYKNFNGKYAVTKEDSSGGKFVYKLTNVEKGYKPFINTTVFYPTKDGVGNLFNKECADKIIEILNKGDFHTFVLSNNGEPFICLNKDPQ